MDSPHQCSHVEHLGTHLAHFSERKEYVKRNTESSRKKHNTYNIMYLVDDDTLVWISA